MKSIIPADMTFSEVGHLPIVKAFAQRIKLVETFDAMVDSQMNLSAGTCVLAMVLDTLSGRTPLYRLKTFFHEKDIELLLGREVAPATFADHNVARVLDKIFDTGTHKIFSKIAQNAIDVFDIDPQRVHFDYIIQSIRTLNPILSERPFYDSFPAVSTLQKCSI